MAKTNGLIRNGLAGLLLVLTIAGLNCWNISYKAEHIAGYSHADPPGQRAVDWSFYGDSARGQIAIRYLTDTYTDPSIIALQAREHYPSRWSLYNVGQVPTKPAGDEIRSFLGFGFQRDSNTSGSFSHHGWTLVLPHAFFVCIFAILAAFLVRQALQRKKLKLRKQLGQCLVCGYDLRASPDRCPECGTVPSLELKQPA